MELSPREGIYGTDPCIPLIFPETQRLPKVATQLPPVLTALHLPDESLAMEVPENVPQMQDALSHDPFGQLWLLVEYTHGLAGLGGEYQLQTLGPTPALPCAGCIQRCSLDQRIKTSRTLHCQRLSTTLSPFYHISSSSNQIPWPGTQHPTAQSSRAETTALDLKWQEEERKDISRHHPPLSPPEILASPNRRAK